MENEIILLCPHTGVPTSVPSTGQSLRERERAQSRNWNGRCLRSCNFFFFFIGDAVTNNFCCSGCLTKTYRLHPIKKVEKYDMHFMGEHQGYTCVAPHLHTWRHFQSIPYDTCSKMILWCWCSWRQRDSCPCLSGTPQYLNDIYNYSLKWTSFLILVFFPQSCERLKEIQGNETKFAKWVNLHV